MMVVSRIKYYKNISTPRHPAWFLYYRSTVFPTQTFRDLLLYHLNSQLPKGGVGKLYNQAVFF